MEVGTLLIDKPLFFSGSSKTKLVVSGRIEIKLSKYNFPADLQQSSPGKTRKDGLRLLEPSRFQATPTKMFHAAIPHEELAVVFLNTAIHRRGGLSSSIFDREKHPHDADRSFDDGIFTLHPRSTVSLVDCRVTCEDARHCKLVCLPPHVNPRAKEDLPRLRMTSTFVSGLSSIGAECLSFVRIAESYFTEFHQNCFVLKSPQFVSISSSKFAENHGNCFDFTQIESGFDGVVSIELSEFYKNSKHCVFFGSTGFQGQRGLISIAHCVFSSNILESIMGEKVSLAQVVVLDCHFEKNHQECIMLNQVRPVAIDSCSFTENKSGCLLASNCTLTFSNNRLLNNLSGVRILGSPVPKPSPVLESADQSPGYFLTFSNDITSNTIERIKEFGIEVFGSPFLEMTIRSNVIRNCKVGVLLSDNYPARLNLKPEPDSFEASKLCLYANRIVDNWEYGLQIDKLICPAHIQGGRITNNHVFAIARFHTAASRVTIEPNLDQSKSVVSGLNMSIEQRTGQPESTSNCALI